MVVGEERGETSKRDRLGGDARGSIQTKRSHRFILRRLFAWTLSDSTPQAHKLRARSFYSERMGPKYKRGGVDVRRLEKG